jgi:hypothetical protein
VRPSADTKGAAIGQCNTGDVFVAYDKLVRGPDGKLWYKLAASVDGDKKIVTAISHDSRFKGASDAYVSAQFASVTETLDSEGSAEFEGLLAASKPDAKVTSKPVDTKPAASARFFPVVIDNAFVGGYQNGKWMRVEELTFKSKGKKLSFNEASGATTGETLDVDFDGLPNGTKLTACVSGQKKATVTLKDKTVWVHFMGWAGVNMDKFLEKEDGNIWIYIDGSLPGAAAPTVRREGDVSAGAYAVEGDEDMAFELTRDPAKDGVDEIGAEMTYEGYAAAVRYGGKSYELDGYVGDEGIGLFLDDYEFDCVFIDVNGDGRQELVLHCYSHTSGGWVYELGPDGPREVLGYNVTNMD